MQITFNVPNAQISRLVNAINGLYPVPQIRDEGGKTSDEFTPNQWAKERVRRFFIETVYRWEKKVAEQNLTVQRDNDLVS